MTFPTVFFDQRHRAPQTTRSTTPPHSTVTLIEAACSSSGEACETPKVGDCLAPASPSPPSRGTARPRTVATMALTRAGGPPPSTRLAAAKAACSPSRLASTSNMAACRIACAPATRRWERTTTTGLEAHSENSNSQQKIASQNPIEGHSRLLLFTLLVPPATGSI